MKEQKIDERLKFLEVYAEFDKWLASFGFRPGHYWTESSTTEDIHYSHYNEHIDALYSVEHYVQDVLKLSIRFLRDRYEHKIMFVAGIGLYSRIYTLEEAKVLILEQVKELRSDLLNALNKIVVDNPSIED